MSETTSTHSSRPTHFGFIYWVANWMELVERFAYYGVRVVLPVFMVEAISNGGPELRTFKKVLSMPFGL